MGGALLAALTLVSAMLLIWNDRRNQVRNWSHTISDVSTTLAAHAEQTLRAADLVIESVLRLADEAGARRSTDLGVTLSSRELFRELSEKVGGVPQLDVVSIVDRHGNVVNFSRQYPPPPINVSDRDYFKSVMAGTSTGTYLSLPVQNRGTGNWTFYLARPILDENGRPIGIVVAGISSRFFEAFYTLVNQGDFSAISLLRADGVLLARSPARQDLVGQVLADDPAIRVMTVAGEEPPVVSVRTARGNPFSPTQTGLVAPRRLASYPLVTSVAVDEDVMLATWWHTAWNVGMLTLALVTALLAMALVLARQLDGQDRTLRELLDAQRITSEVAAARAALLEELQTSEARLIDKSRTLELTLENIDQGLFMVAADQSVPVCNRRAMELLDLPRELMLSRPNFPEIVEYQRSRGEFGPGVPDAPDAPGSAAMRRQLHNYERERPNGTILEVHTIPLPDGGMVRTFTDITARRKSEEQVRFFAQHDGLTQLVNRTVVQSTLEEAIRRHRGTGGGIAAHYLDLDGFKLVNDTFGHAVGDRLLTEVAARLRRTVRDADTVGRMGGDEFAIIQPMGDPLGYEHLARRVLAAVGEPYVIGELQCVVGVSIGIALFPQHSRTAEALMRDADAALYRAKANGKGRFWLFDETMDRRQQHVLQLEQDLKQAIAQKEFFLEYQPIVHAGSLEPACFEALVRWRHPVRGVLGPSEFIEMAERLALIVPLGLWVLETASAEAATWPASISLSVNVSPVQFSRGDLPAAVAGVLGRTGLEPHRLTLEVTEGVLLEETPDVRDAMASLRSLGVRFSLDDFGTAQSRLSYLRRFPFDVIKIDRSFVEDLVTEEGSQAIVGAVLAIGRAFQLQVVAEGVEDAAQLALLRVMGCELVQGYLLGRPHAEARTRVNAYIESS